MARILPLIALFIFLLSLLILLPFLFSLVAVAPEDKAPAYVTPDHGDAPAVKPDGSEPLPPPPLPAPDPEPEYDLGEMELGIHALVNGERVSNGLAPLAYNEELAGVAREHSANLARENLPLTEPDIYCPDIFIHHEGTDFGLYEADRLSNRSIYYYEAVGENIYMTSTWSYQRADAPYPPCLGELEIIYEYDSLGAMEADYEKRLEYSETALRVNWTEIVWMDQEALERSIVEGWMESPGHRANILEPVYGEAGIGIAKVNNFVIVTQLFIDRAECGYIGADCCIEGDYAWCYEPWDCDGTCG